MAFLRPYKKRGLFVAHLEGGQEGFLRQADTVSRAMIFWPMAAWMATWKSWRGMVRLSLRASERP